MSHKKGKETHSGENYTPSVCNVIFFMLIRGVNIKLVANMFGRSEDAIYLLFRRICLNATDEDGKRNLSIFKLKPLVDIPWTTVNAYADYFMEAQLFIVEAKSNSLKVSKQTGIPLRMVREREVQLAKMSRRNPVTLSKFIKDQKHKSRPDNFLTQENKMGMAPNVYGIKPPDKKWKAMKAVWDTCTEAGIDIPKEVDAYFDGEEPDNSGVLVDLEDHECCTIYDDKEQQEGFEIDLTELTQDIKKIRFVNSY